MTRPSSFAYPMPVSVVLAATRANEIERRLMARYRKRPLEVEAYQTDEAVQVETPDEVMLASAGDYIITEDSGDTYPCTAEIFEKTYERVE